MTLPFAALRSRILIPISAADQVWPAVSIHVDGGDTFVVVRTQSMREEGRLRNVARSIARRFIELRGCDSQSNHNCAAYESDLTDS